MSHCHPPIHPFHFQKSISNFNKTQLINLCFTTHQSSWIAILLLTLYLHSPYLKESLPWLTFFSCNEEYTWCGTYFSIWAHNLASWDVTQHWLQHSIWEWVWRCCPELEAGKSHKDTHFTLILLQPYSSGCVLSCVMLWDGYLHPLPTLILCSLSSLHAGSGTSMALFIFSQF